MYTNTGTRMNGYELFFVRTVWLILFSLILLVFLLGIPRTFKIALTLHPETVAGLEQLGLQASFPAIYIIALETFSEAMSEEVDLAPLTERLLSVVQETMHPTFVSLWIRKSENQQTKRVTRVLPKIGDQVDVY